MAARLWIAVEVSACGRVGVHLLPQREDASLPDAGAARDSGSGLLDAGTVPDAGAVLDASLPDAGAVLDASSPDAGQPRPAAGVRVQVDNGLGPELTSYPVRVTLDSAAAIAAGLLRPDCTGLSVALSDHCAAPLPYFLPESACNSAFTELWVRVPTIPANGRVELDVTWAGRSGARSEGANVFPFFDDFDGNAVDSTRWKIIGDGSVSVSGGVLGAIGTFMLQSVATLVSAGDSTVGVRLAAQGARTPMWRSAWAA